MSITTDALVLKSFDTSESDKVVTLLTADYGIVRAFANRAKKINSKMQSATQTLSYGTFSLYAGRDSYTINDAQSKEVFFGLRNNIEALSLGQYFCSLAIELIAEGEPASESLRVILNSLSFLQNEKRSLNFIKAVTEIKLLSVAGFAPNFSVCAGCGGTGGGAGKFFIPEGKYYCQNCVHSGDEVSAGVVRAFRQIIYSPVDRIYSFSLPENDEVQLMNLSEKFLLHVTGKKFKTLDFYKSLVG